MSRGSYPSQSPSVFSMLKHGEPDSPRRRSPITTVFTSLGDREKNVSTRLGERERGVFSRLGRESTSRHRQTSAKRDASDVRDQNHRIREARNLVRSYVTCSSERQREIKREWDATDRANRRNPTQDEERYLSESENDGGGHWKSKKQKSTTDEEDLSQPWLTVYSHAGVTYSHAGVQSQNHSSAASQITAGQSGCDTQPDVSTLTCAPEAHVRKTLSIF
ncbi:hypothetical protein Tco_1435257 [Tanacetum coccineum]